MNRSFLVGAVLLSGCASGRTMRFESSVPAAVQDSSGQTLCAATPCEWRLSRETCWLLDSSLGFFRVRAIASDGTKLEAPALKTCDVREGTLVRFRFAGPQTPTAKVDVLD